MTLAAFANQNNKFQTDLNTRNKNVVVWNGKLHISQPFEAMTKRLVAIGHCKSLFMSYNTCKNDHGGVSMLFVFTFAREGYQVKYNRVMKKVIHGRDIEELEEKMNNIIPSILKSRFRFTDMERCYE